jgi:hypothetical protein
MAFQQDFLGLVPVSVLHRALQVGPMVTVEVLKYPILILQASVSLFLGSILLNRRKAPILRPC